MCVFLVQFTSELMDSMMIPASVKVYCEASSLVVEWSHDVCRFLLKWFKLNPFRSSREAAKDIRNIDKSIGMSLIEIYFISFSTTYLFGLSLHWIVFVPLMCERSWEFLSSCKTKKHYKPFLYYWAMKSLEDAFSLIKVSYIVAIFSLYSITIPSEPQL